MPKTIHHAGFFLIPKDQTDDYKEVVRTLTRMYERGDNPTRASAEGLSSGLYDDMITKQGLQRSASGGDGIWRLLHKRYHSPLRLEGGCGPAGMNADHPELYLKDRKPHMWACHPYDFGLEDMKLLVDFCAKYNLTASIHAYSWYFPGATTLVRVWRSTDKVLSFVKPNTEEPTP